MMYDAVQPAAKAAPIRLATMDEGKVHAVIAAYTPIGCRSTRIR